ncbi:MAG: ParB N-terminal domain-containing protein, partial [Anaerolineales bacterium]
IPGGRACGMTALPILPELQVLPTASLRAHEQVERSRVEPLVRSLDSEGVLRNPVIVMPLPGPPEAYVILDGANRSLAFRELDISDILVQIVRPEFHQVEVKGWNHALLGGRLEPVVAGWQRIPGTRWVEGRSPGEGTEPVVKLIDSSDREFAVFAADASLGERVRVVQVAATAYLEDFRIERTVTGGARGLREIYPDLSGLVVFSPFSIDDVLEMAQQNWTFPAGLTRFIVSPRALHVNYPMHELRASRSLRAKQRRLQEWVRRKVQERRVRFYAESTFLFDE